MLGFKKVPAFFDITHSETIKSVDIKDAGSLINYIIGVNDYLITHEKKGWILIKKSRSHKKGERLLYVDKLELPLYEDNPYFVERLNFFYTEKEIPYDTSLLSDEQTETSLKDKGVTTSLDEKDEISKEPNVSKELTDLMDKGNKILSEPPKEKELPLIQARSNAYEMEVEELKRQLVEKDRQIASVTSQMARMSVPEPPKVEPSVIINNNTQDVSTLISTVVTQKVSQLEKEMTMRDTRHSIKETVVKEYQTKKETAIENKVIELDIEKKIKLDQVEKEYKNMIEKIESEHVITKDKELELLTARFEEECRNRINEEYRTQTEKLSHYLEKRKEEIMNWHISLNNDIDSKLLRLSSSLQLIEE